MAAVLPTYYSSVAAAGLGETTATSYWGYTAALALAVIAVISPVLGAVADYLGVKKRLLAVFMSLGVTFTALLWFVGEGDWLLASAIFIVANIGFAGANVFYESLLPSIARGDELDRVSTAGYALGYLGGGMLLALNAAWLISPQTFGFADQGVAARASFVSAAVWWAVFSVPLFRRVDEPRPRLVPGETADLRPGRVALGRVASTLREIRHYPDLFLFLLAFLVYNDGVNTIVKMAAVYGKEVGIETAQIIAALVVVQFVGIPSTFAFGHLSERITAKKGVLVCLVVYGMIAAIGFVMDAAWQFWMLAVMVGTVQGGVQGLSRSLYASMIPAGRSTEFFGFYSVSSKFAGITGPLFFAIVGQTTGSSRWGILSLLLFFVVGAALLLRVDVSAGRSLAREAEERMRPKTEV
jgi:MFS transporter, UMF1 family